MTENEVKKHYDCRLCENYRPRKATRKEKLILISEVWIVVLGIVGGSLFYVSMIFEAVGL